MPKDPSEGSSAAAAGLGPGTGPSKSKQTRRRIPRTCAQCRKRKQKCDSLKPCAVCKLRGEADLCDYEGAQPTRVIDDDDSSIPISATELQRLRSQLDGLESLVSKVVYRNSNGNSNGGARGDDETSIVELEENDVAAALSRMMLTRTLVSGVASDPPIVEKIRGSCRAIAPHRPEWSESTFSLIGVANTFTSWYSQPDPELHALLPNINQAALLYHTYWTEFEWYHSCFPRARFEEGLNAFYKRDPEAALNEESAELQWITMATLFAVARLAIMRVPNADATAKALPLSTSDRLQRSVQWLRAGLSCLNRANFEGKPRIESITCLIVLLEALWFDGPMGGTEDTALLYELKCKAMNLGFDLGLHRDPSHREDGRAAAGLGLDADQCHQRRMLWWALLSLDGLYSAVTGRVSSLVSLDAVDVYLPALSTAPVENERHEGCPRGCQVATQVTGVKPRLLIGFVSHEICRLAMRRSPPPTIRDLNKAQRDLASLEAHLPSTHKLFEVGHTIDRSRLPTCLRARRDAFHFYHRFYCLAIRLQRPLHTVQKIDDVANPSSQHRSLVVHYALLLLDLRKVAEQSPHFVLGGLTGLIAGISLALDLLLRPTSEEAPTIRRELDSLLTFFAPANAPCVRRGTFILESILEIVDAAGTSSASGASWFAIEDDPISPTSWANGPFHQPPESASFASFNPYDPSTRHQALPVFQPMTMDSSADNLGSIATSQHLAASGVPQPWSPEADPVGGFQVPPQHYRSSGGPDPSPSAAVVPPYPYASGAMAAPQPFEWGTH